MQRERGLVDDEIVASCIKCGTALVMGVATGCGITSSEAVLDPVTIDWSDEGQVAVCEQWNAYGCEGSPVASICFDLEGKSVGRLVLGTAVYEPDSGEVDLDLLTDERAKELSSRFDCGELDIRRVGHQSLVVAGVDGIRTTHRLSDPQSGRDIELIQYMAVVEAELITLTTASAAPQGCVSPDDMWIESSILVPILPFFDGIAAGLPQSDTPLPAEPEGSNEPPSEGSDSTIVEAVAAGYLTPESQPILDDLATRGTDRPVEESADPTDQTSGFSWGEVQDHQLKDFLIGPCGGEAPMACISRDGEFMGAIEYWTTPTSSFDFLDESASNLEAINLIASDYFETNGDSKPLECPGLTYRTIGPSEARVASEPGLLWGFAMLDAGKVSDLSVVYGVVQDDRLHLLTANASSERACFEIEGRFSISDLGKFGAGFRLLAAHSVWPEASDPSK